MVENAHAFFFALRMFAHNLAAGSVNFGIDSRLMEFMQEPCERSLPKAAHRTHSAERHSLKWMVLGFGYVSVECFLTLSIAQQHPIRPWLTPYLESSAKME